VINRSLLKKKNASCFLFLFPKHFRFVSNFSDLVEKKEKNGVLDFMSPSVELSKGLKIKKILWSERNLRFFSILIDAMPKAGGHTEQIEE